jgi:hypothetical protein
MQSQEYLRQDVPEGDQRLLKSSNDHTGHITRFGFESILEMA